MAQNTSDKRIGDDSSAGATCRRAEENKKQKEGKKKDTRNSGKLASRPDHPRRRIKIKLCMLGGLRCVVMHVECDPNWLTGYGAVGVENGPFLLLWPVAYTTACTILQAVIIVHDCCCVSKFPVKDLHVYLNFDTLAIPELHYILDSC